MSWVKSAESVSQGLNFQFCRVSPVRLAYQSPHFCIVSIPNDTTKIIIKLIAVEIIEKGFYIKEKIYFPIGS
jgi:hypothetical protein